MNDGNTNPLTNAAASTPPFPKTPNDPEKVNQIPVRSTSQTGKTETNSEPVSSGSPLKMAVPIALLVAVVFGITFFAQYSPKAPDDDNADRGGGQSAALKTEPPLRFGTSIRMWNPLGNLQDQVFPGFFEGGETLNSTSYWFENRNPAPVTMQLIKVSCTKCSGGRLAAIPPEVTDQLVATSLFSGFPQGLVNLLPVSFIGTSANLAPSRLVWQDYTYRVAPNAEYKIPAAPGTTRLFPNQWGIFDLQFQVSGAAPSKTLQADFSLQVEGSKTAGIAALSVVFEGVDAFEVSKKLIDVGDWTETTEPRTFNFIVYSSTRGPNRTGPSDRGDLDVPIVDVRTPGNLGDPGPFVTVSPAQRVPEAELPQVTLDISQSLKKMVRVESAYRYAVTVNPKVGDQRLDIGLLEREIFLAFKDIKEPKIVRVKGMVRGSIWLDNNRTDIDLPSYRSRDGTSQTVRLIAEQRDTVVELLKEECTPRFAEYHLDKLPPASDRGYYQLRVDIPPGSPTGSWNGVILLEIKGPHPQRIRVPIRGVAKF